VTHVGIYEGSGLMVNASKRHGCVRRDDVNESFWATRFMFARRMSNENWRDDRESPRRRAERNTDARREAVRALGRIAEALLRRYPR
jgi:hypothetical protein